MFIHSNLLVFPANIVYSRNVIKHKLSKLQFVEGLAEIHISFYRIELFSMSKLEYGFFPRGYRNRKCNRNLYEADYVLFELIENQNRYLQHSVIQESFHDLKLTGNNSSYILNSQEKFINLVVFLIRMSKLFSFA